MLRLSEGIIKEIYIRNKEGIFLSYASGLLNFTAITTGTHFIDIGDKGKDDTGEYTIKASKII